MTRLRNLSSLSRLAFCLGAGGSVALVAWLLHAVHPWLIGWLVTAGVYVVTTWIVLAPLSAKETGDHATREDPTQAGTIVLGVVAALGSLVSVFAAMRNSEDTPLVVGTLVGVVLSWAAIHTLFASYYARVYYTPPVGGIDFNQTELPVYSDFAYVAFTLGMSFAISDTNLSGTSMRRPALVHALLSYVFGTVIVAMTVNLIASFAR